jgi:hypothetical protein
MTDDRKQMTDVRRQKRSEDGRQILMKWEFGPGFVLPIAELCRGY